MRHTALTILITLCFASGSFAQTSLQYGVYKLKGTNPDGMKKYEGKVVLQREGINYRVTWFIGSSQSQSGIGILENGVLSIGYMDLTGTDFGVVSMKVVNKKTLKGKWSSIFSKGGFGEEEFTFETESIPATLTPKPVKSSGDDKTI